MAIRDLSIKIRMDLSEVEKELKDLEARIKALSKEKIELQIKADSLQNVKQELVEIQTILNALEKEKSKIELDSSSMIGVKEEIEQLDRQIQSLEEKKRVISLGVGELEATNRAIRELENDINALDSRKASVNLEAEDIHQASRAMLDLIGTLADISGKKTSIGVDASDVEVAMRVVADLQGSLEVKNFPAIILQADTSQLDNAHLTLEDFANTAKSVEEISIQLDVDGKPLLDMKETIDEINGNSIWVTVDDEEIKQASRNTESLRQEADRGINLNLGVDSSGIREAKEELSQLEKNAFKVNDLMVTGLGFGVFAEIARGAVRSVTGQISDAVGRYDTLNNFPVVMQYLGYSAEQADDALSRLTDSIIGLPTPLQDITRDTQQLAVAFQDLEFAVDVMSVLNASLLLENNTMADVEAGTRQWLSVLQRGEPTYQQWISLVRYSGLALTDVANQLGYYTDEAEGGRTATDKLYGAMSDGKHDMQDVIRTLIELEASTGKYSEGASKATAGIQTGFANMRTSFTRGITEIIGSLDNALSSFGGIAGVLSGFGRAVETTLTGIANVIRIFDNNLAGLAVTLVSAKLAIIGLKKALMGLKGLKFLTKIPFIGGLFGGKTANPKKWLQQLKSISVMAAGAGTIILFAEAIDQVNRKVPENLAEVMPKLANLALAGTAVFGLAKLAGTISNSAQMVKGVTALTMATLSLFPMIELISRIDDIIPDSILELQKKIASFALVTTELFLLVSLAGMAWPASLGAILGSISISAVSASLMLLVQTVKMIDEEVPDNLSSVKYKLESLKEIVDTMKSNNPISAFATMVATTFDLVTTAMVSQMVSIYTQMLDMFKIINDSSVDFVLARRNIEDLTDIVQDLSSNKGIFSSLRRMVATGFNAQTTTIVNNMVGVLKDISIKLNELNGLNVDFKKSKSNLEEIDDIVQFLTTDKGIFSNMFKSKAQSYDFEIVKSIESIVNSYLAISETLKELIGIDDMDYGKAKEDIENIDNIVKFLTTEQGRISNWWKSSAMAYEEGIVESVKGIISMYVDIANSLKALISIEDLDYTEALKSITAIDEVVTKLVTDDSFREAKAILMAQQVDSSIVEEIRNVISYYFEIAQSLEQLAKIPSVDITTGRVQVSNINLAIKELRLSTDDIRTYGSVISQQNELEVVRAIRETIDSYFDIAKALQRLSDISIKEIRENSYKVKAIHDLVGELVTELSKRQSNNQMQAQNNFAETVRTIQTTIEAYIDIGRLMKSIESEFAELGDKPFDKSIKVIDEINDAVEQMGVQTQSLFKSVIAKYQSSNEQKTVENIAQIVSDYLAIGDNLVRLEKLEITSEGPKNAIGAINTAMDEMVKGVWNGNFKNKNVEILTSFKDIVVGYTEIARELLELQGVEIEVATLLGKLNAIESVLNRMVNLEITVPQEGSGLRVAQQILEDMQGLVKDLQGLNPDFVSIGHDSFGSGLYEGFQKFEVPRKILKLIEDLVRDLNKKQKDFRDIGKKYGDELKKAFEKSVKDMSRAIDGEVKAINGKTRQFSNAGTNLGNSLRIAFINAISGMPTAVNNQLSAINTAPTVRAPSGGGSASARGGTLRVGGVDPVPFSPFEYTQLRNSPMDVGNPSLDVGRALNHFAKNVDTRSTVQTPISTVVNNINNVDNHKDLTLTQHIHSDSKNYNEFQRLSRFLRGS